jgi:hypothetical protein
MCLSGSYSVRFFIKYAALAGCFSKVHTVCGHSRFPFLSLRASAQKALLLLDVSSERKRAECAISTTQAVITPPVPASMFDVYTPEELIERAVRTFFSGLTEREKKQAWKTLEIEARQAKESEAL